MFVFYLSEQKLCSYVVVTFVDGSEKPPTFVSNVVMDNGLNPNFSLECSATMASPRHSFLVISVFDQNPGQDAFVGQCAIPVYAVRSGYRSALLMDEQFAALGKGLGHVLLHIKIKK